MSKSSGDGQAVIRARSHRHSAVHVRQDKGQDQGRYPKEAQRFLRSKGNSDQEVQILDFLLWWERQSVCDTPYDQYKITYTPTSII